MTPGIIKVYKRGVVKIYKRIGLKVEQVGKIKKLRPILVELMTGR